MSSREVGWDCKDWWLGLDTSVLLSNRDCGVPVTGLLCAVVVEHKQPGQGTGCTCGAGVAPLSLRFLSPWGGGDTCPCTWCQTITNTEETI